MRSGRLSGLPACLIVVPCYNEAERLPADAFLTFARDQDAIGFVLVDDGSTDGTGSRLEALRAGAPDRFSVLALTRNRGKAYAVRAGVQHALRQDPVYVGYWDADLATPLDEVLRFLAELERRPELGAVFGARVRMLGHEIERRALRHGLGRVFATAVARQLRLPVYDTQCGAKLFRVSDETRALFAEPFRSGWAFDVELLARWRLIVGDALRERVRELPLNRWRDVPGSKVRPLDFFRAWLELWRIRRAYSRSD